MFFQVRRGSEPSLNKSPQQQQQHAYRQFANATPLGLDDHQNYLLAQSVASSSSSTLVAQPEASGGGESENYDSLPDSAAFDSKCSLNVLRRREPLGASAGNNNKQEKGAKGGAGGEHQWSVAPAPAEDAGRAQFQQRQQMVRPSVEIVIPNEIGERAAGMI